MLFETLGDRKNPAVLFFHAMGVTGASSMPVARALQDGYFCILPTSTVYSAGQKYRSKADEVRQIETFLQEQGVKRLALVVASSIGADAVMQAYPQGNFPVFEGYNHMQYQIRDPHGFAALLRSVAEQGTLPEIPGLHP